MITVQASGISECSQTETGHSVKYELRPVHIREFNTEVVYLVTYAEIL